MTVKIDMEMPKSCGVCPFNRLGRWIVKPFCIFTDRPIKNGSKKMRPCPLKECK